MENMENFLLFGILLDSYFTLVCTNIGIKTRKIVLTLSYANYIVAQICPDNVLVNVLKEN